MIDLRHMDCMEYLASCEDNAFELAIVDPPYGIGAGKPVTIGKRKGQAVHTKYKSKQWDSCVPSQEYFDELRVKDAVALFGIIHEKPFVELDGFLGWVDARGMLSVSVRSTKSFENFGRLVY